MLTARISLRRALLALCMALTSTGTLIAPFTNSLHVARAISAPSGLHVQGTSIVDSLGHKIRLLGVDRSGTQTFCVHNWNAIFDGPSDAASLQPMLSWHINAVRVPLNEDCWLGINGVDPQYSGANYRNAITTFVNLLTSNGLIPIVDLHISAPGTQLATRQAPMPDEDHAPAFWASVATQFKDNTSVIFDLFNEPNPDTSQGMSSAWPCWRDGGTCPNIPFRVAGMQELVNVVRATGAPNLLMLGGITFAESLGQWPTYRPHDPLNNIAAAWHSYDISGCANPTCWVPNLAPALQVSPVIVGEIGEYDCGHGYIDSLMPWLDTLGVSYLAWGWNTGNCSQGPMLLTDYSGTPSVEGQSYQAHLAALASTPPPATPPACQPATWGAALSSSLSLNAGQVTGTFSGTAPCAAAIGLAVYKFPNGLPASQVLYQVVTATVTAGNPTALSVPVPSCDWAAYAFIGPVLTTFVGGVGYGSRYLGATWGGTRWCP